MMLSECWQTSRAKDSRSLKVQVGQRNLSRREEGKDANEAQ